MRLATAIEAVRHEAATLSEEVRAQTDLEARFEEVVALLSSLDIETLWEAAEDQERRVIIENMIESVTVFPDHLEVKVAGSAALHVLYSEFRLVLRAPLEPGDVHNIRLENQALVGRLRLPIFRLHGSEWVIGTD
jgi:hypothetical protein